MLGLLSPVFVEPGRHIRRWFSDAAYRDYCALRSKIKSLPRFTELHVKCGSLLIVAPDAASLLSTYRQVFVDQIYAFRSESDSPRILDLGANIGLSVLFFKLLYPRARITAVEADPDIFRDLGHNLSNNGVEDVELVNAAVWSSSGSVRFKTDGADGGHVDPGDDNGQVIPAIEVQKLFTDGPIDLLKMDIEGAEEVVLPACASLLGQVRYVFVEYHSRVGCPQRLDEITGILRTAGFRIDVQDMTKRRSPLMRGPELSDFDLQLNIFGWKNG